jgi:3-vinyl bacteriochlorophyllide hydratase
MQRTLSYQSHSASSRGFRLGNALEYVIEWIAPCPWVTISASHSHKVKTASPERRPLYSAEERIRRDESKWTLVQGILAPVQFAIFLGSLFLVIRYLASGDGYELANASVVIKTVALYAIMITGAIWEKVVFGKYLFAKAFFWEDVFSMAVLGLHTAYLAGLFFGFMTPSELMICALVAYAAYAINATQFVMKLRMARLDRAHEHTSLRFARGNAA